MCGICFFVKNGRLPESETCPDFGHAVVTKNTRMYLNGCAIVIESNSCAELTEIANIALEGPTIEGLRVRCFQVAMCPNLKTINLPQKWDSMRCFHCPRLSSISGPGELRTIELTDCPELRAIPVPAGMQFLYMYGCPLVRFIPFVPGLKLQIGRQPFTFVSRRYGAHAMRTSEAKVRRWIWRGRVAARARAELGCAALLISPLANIVVAYLAPRHR